jgi:hypothetical protein
MEASQAEVPRILKGEKMERNEHLQWCKDRAMEYINRGEINEAFASFNSDMNKHPETANHSALKLGAMLFFGGHLKSTYDMEKWIKGFN